MKKAMLKSIESPYCGHCGDKLRLMSAIIDVRSCQSGQNLLKIRFECPEIAELPVELKENSPHSEVFVEYADIKWGVGSLYPLPDNEACIYRAMGNCEGCYLVCSVRS
jgi:hypothetical protein